MFSSLTLATILNVRDPIDYHPWDIFFLCGLPLSTDACFQNIIKMIGKNAQQENDSSGLQLKLMQ